jgi:ubiquinone/menaquinone biosynthesis C-methylase UbiE
MQNRIVKEQFNKQAEKFANWSIGKNIQYLNAYFDFCEIRSDDKVLDVACGPGDFTIFMAKRVMGVQGVDISDKEIDIASTLAHELGLCNIGFDCFDVENLPYKNGSYSVVVCKSAFHHFTSPELILKEMKRCCETGGKISIQDIVAYEDDYVNEFFETFDKLVDISHYKTLNVHDFNTLFQDNSILKIKDFKLSVDLNVIEYINHAKQDKENKIKLNQLIDLGKKDNRLSEFLFVKNNELYFKREVYLILGRK